MEKHVTLLCYNNNNKIETIKTDIVAIIENNKLIDQCLIDIFKKYPYINTIEDRIWETNDTEVICRASTTVIEKHSVIGCYIYTTHRIKCLPLFANNEKYNKNINYMTPILNYYVYYDDSLYYRNIKDISYIFYDYSLTSLNISKFDTSKVTTMSYIFSDCENLTSITFGDNFDTSNVTDMSGMFNCCESLTSITFGDNFDTSNVTDMSAMFNCCGSLTSLNISNFDTSSVTDMSGMFDGCESLTSITFGDNFDTSNVTNMSYMFSDCKKLTYLDVSKFDTSNVENMEFILNNCDSLEDIYLNNHSIGKVLIKILKNL